MITFPKSVAEAGSAISTGGQVIRAGGTDLSELRRHHIRRGPLVDLRDLGGLDTIETSTDGFVLGAMVRLSALAHHQDIIAQYPGIAASAGALATPQIRNVATVGGNLLQSSRCWYFRNPDASCYKSGGEGCPARKGDHLYHACFDLGPCISPHPSTLGLALLAYEASIRVEGGENRSVEALYGDGTDPTKEHQLTDKELLTHVVLPAPVEGEYAAYFRSISRAYAEWPLVEVLARMTFEDDTITMARVAIGGVAPIPLRLSAVEVALEGQRAGEETFANAAALGIEGASPLPMTAYKLKLIPDTIIEALQRIDTQRGQKEAV